jgi:serine/threonine protein kinase
VQVFDFGIGGQNFPYYTMELLLGESLANRLDRLKRLESHEALAVFVAVAGGMAHAHRQGIVHRDIKPANIFIQKSKAGGRPKIVDFGLAKLAASQSIDSQTVTGAGLIFGSPLYMSPEQSHGLETDQRTDIYSFGCSLFQALTGTPPFVGDNALATITMHHEKVPPRLGQTAPGVIFPERLEAVVAKLLAKDVKKRYQSFEEVEKDLAAISLPVLNKNDTPLDDEKEGGPGSATRAWALAVQSDTQEVIQEAGGIGTILLIAATVLTLIGVSAIAFFALLCLAKACSSTGAPLFF